MDGEERRALERALSEKAAEVVRAQARTAGARAWLEALLRRRLTVVGPVGALSPRNDDLRAARDGIVRAAGSRARREAELAILREKYQNARAGVKGD